MERNLPISVLHNPEFRDWMEAYMKFKEPPLDFSEKHERYMREQELAHISIEAGFGKEMAIVKHMLDSKHI